MWFSTAELIPGLDIASQEAIYQVTSRYQEINTKDWKGDPYSFASVCLPSQLVASEP